MAHIPVNVLKGDMQQNAEDHICAKVHVEHNVSCVLKCYKKCIFLFRIMVEHRLPWVFTSQKDKN